MIDTLVFWAFVADLILGDPRWLPHPIVYIGSLINTLETVLAGIAKNRRRAGIILVALTLFVTGAVVAGLLEISALIHPLLGWLVALWLSFSTLALHSLHRESREVVALVEAGCLEEARRSLALIVGRETASLTEEEILRACVETVAENTSDGVVAPLFYLLLGGPLLAMLYKAVNTLDSMVGYRDERYLELGWASAKLDDLLNLIPARLTGVLMAFCAFPLGLDGFGALRIMRRDARKHVSPNAGFPEAAAAGALGVRLGGPAIYFGRIAEKETLGDAVRPVTPAVYHRMVRLMYLTSLGTLVLGLLIKGVL